MNIVGYCICGQEADRYLRETLEEFKRLCDHTIIVLNNATDKERDMIAEYGFQTKEDNRVWGENQHKIKQDLMVDVAKLNPDYCVALDADEVFDPEFTRETIEEYAEHKGLYVYIVNLWDDGWNKPWSFWNIRAWKWTGDTKFSNRPLHCGLAPESAYYYGSYIPYYLKHSGLKKKEDRMKKVERYKKFDPKAIYKDVSYYNELAGGHVTPLDYDYIKKALKDEVGGPKVKMSNEAIKKEFVNVINPAGKVVDIPKDQLDETLAREGFKLCK